MGPAMLWTMSRHSTFKFCLDPTLDQQQVLARHGGASRFAYNQCLRMVENALTERRTDAGVAVPWTGFDLVNAFNAWKKTDAAGRIITVDSTGVAEVVATGLSWRAQVCQQVFEEAAVDLGKGLKAWSESRSGARRGKRVGFPRFKKKTSAVPSFRLRNKRSKSGKTAIRVGDDKRPRSITLPGIGPIAVRDDTRRLRRMLATRRAKVCFATISHRGGRWWASLNVEAADLHPDQQHRPRSEADTAGWVGVDRGLTAFVVAADAAGAEVAHIADAPKALAVGIGRQRRLARQLSRSKKGSKNRHQVANKLRRHHRHVTAVRRHFLHRASNMLVKTHDRLVIEDLHVAGMLANHRLARAISDAGWSEFGRMLRYKQAWRGGQILVADRWYPSSKCCAACGVVNTGLTLADRVFSCSCGYTANRDLNAATNLARWAHAHHDAPRSPDPQAGGRATNARRRDGPDRQPLLVKPTRKTWEPMFMPPHAV